jgi:hypothetical protein
MSRFDPVTQKEEWGCGVACVASLLDVSYEEAKALLKDEKGKSVNKGTPGLELHHIAIALQKRDVKVIADWEDRSDFPNGTIVCIADDALYEGEHYMLKTPKGWMDPWSNMGEMPRRAEFRNDYPDGTWFLVALVPKSD